MMIRLRDILMNLSLLNIDLPGFFISKFIVNNKKNLICSPLFLSTLTRGLNDKKYYDVSYISDLGLRRTDEPTKYFLQNASRYLKDNHNFIGSLDAYDSTVKSLFELLNIKNSLPIYNFSQFIIRYINQPDVLNNTLKYYADVLGNWEDADIMANIIFEKRKLLPSNEANAALLSNSGNLFAQIGDIRCKTLYQEAYDLWENPYQKFTSIFRIAVANIKRLNNKDSIPNSIKESLDEAVRFGERTNNVLNTEFCVGLIKNLEALYWLKQRDIKKVGKCITEAWETVSKINSSELDMWSDISNRYRIQILENLGMYSGMALSWDKAISILKDGVQLSRECHPDSLPEVLSIYGYVLTQSGLLKEALPVLLEAEDLFSKTVWIDKVNEVRKMLVVVNDGLANESQSNYWFEKIAHLYEGVS